MATPQQIELAKKYYTQEQINQEMANPGSVKRVAAVGTPTYEQPVNGQFASASTAPTPPLVQPRPGVTQQGNTLNVTQDIYSQLSPNTLAQAQNKGFNVQTSQAVPQAQTTPQPVPGSVSSILGEGFGAEDPFVSQYYKDQLSQYNQTIDPQAAYNEQLALRQAQIDATNALYRDQLNQARIQGQGRLGSGRAIQSRGGLLGSSFGAAQTNQIQSANTDIENAIEQERLAVVNQIMTNARSSAAADIAEKRAAKEAGGKAYLEYLAGADTRKKEKVSKAAQLLLSLGKSPQDISDEELKQAGISRQDLTMEYTTGKSAQEAAASAAKLTADKTQAEIDKINADIEKGQLDAMKYYEVGNKIYARNEDGTSRYIGDAVFNPYSGAMQVTPGNSVYNPVTNTFTQAPTGAFSTNAPAGGFRTDRHNNPTAMTTDVARTLGLVEGVDYTKGDPFPNNPNLFTARLNGDPIQTTIKALDLAAQDPNKSAFRTQGGQPRWTYIDMTDEQWNSMTPEQKTATITKMYQNEGGTGALVGGGGGQTGGYNPDLSTAYQNYNTGKLSPTELTMLTKQTGGIEEFARQAKEYGREIAVTQALPQLENYKKDLQWLKDNYSNLGKAGAFFNVGDFDAILRNVTNKTAFQELTRLKEMGATFGALSEKEFANIGSSTEIGKLKPTAGKETWTNALDRLIKEVETAQNKITGGTQPPTTPAAGTQTGTEDAYALYLKSIGQ